MHRPAEGFALRPGPPREIGIVRCRLDAAAELSAAGLDAASALLTGQGTNVAGPVLFTRWYSCVTSTLCVSGTGPILVVRGCNARDNRARLRSFSYGIHKMLHVLGCGIALGDFDAHGVVQHPSTSRSIRSQSGHQRGRRGATLQPESPAPGWAWAARSLGRQRRTTIRPKGRT